VLTVQGDARRIGRDARLRYRQMGMTSLSGGVRILAQLLVVGGDAVNTTVTETFAYSLPNYAWAFLSADNSWHQIEQGAGADSVTNMFMQLVEARSTGANVTVGLNANNKIYFVLF
jgi:hypothetical protein